MTETISSLATFITSKILKQPKRVITADESLISSGLIDSFSLVDLALFVEDNFGVRIRRAQTIEEHLQLSIVYKQFFAGEFAALRATLAAPLVSNAPPLVAITSPVTGAETT